MRIGEIELDFRKDRAADLRKLAELLDKKNLCITTNPIYEAAKHLEDPKYLLQTKRVKSDKKNWGYIIEEIRFAAMAPPKNVSADNIQVELNISVVADCNSWGKDLDPLLDLRVHVAIVGITCDGERSHFGFHVDRHPEPSAHGREAHPVYHWQPLIAPRDSDAFNCGQVLAISAPRIMHYPLDLVLAVEYVLSNFCPQKYEDLLSEPEYMSLRKKYQRALWAPYARAFASAFGPNTSPHWNAEKICPTLAPR